MHVLVFFVGKREKNAMKYSVNMNIDTVDWSYRRKGNGSDFL